MEHTVQRKSGKLNKLQDIKRLQLNSFPQPHRGEGRPPVPTERALLLHGKQMMPSFSLYIKIQISEKCSTAS